MGAWQYCRSCENGLSRPTVGELLERDKVCPSCGAHNAPVGDVAEALTELEAKVDWLLALAREAGREPPF